MALELCHKLVQKLNLKYLKVADINIMGKCGVAMLEINHLCLGKIIKMLTLEEVLSDVADNPGFSNLQEININSRGIHEETPMHWMATLGDIAGIRLLIEAGADINAIDDDGNSPLHEAVSNRQANASRFLIESGSNLLCKNKAGMTPFEVAKSDNYTPILELFT